MNNPDETLKPAVFSRWHNGQSVKTDRYRYTEWFKTGEPPYARMLYDHKTDPMENVNISERPENKELVEQMHELLHTR
jgi:hypothetical protein